VVDLFGVKVADLTATNMRAAMDVRVLSAPQRARVVEILVSGGMAREQAEALLGDAPEDAHSAQSDTSGMLTMASLTLF
jgi:hypothetical protein